MKIEARALKTLDEITLAWLDLVLPKSFRLGAISDNPIALMLDIEFSWANLKMLILLQDSNNTLK